MVTRDSGTASGRARYKTLLGEAVWSTPAPGVVLVRYRGHAEVALYEPIAKEMDRQVAQFPKVRLFVDFEELASYDTEFRTRWTDWFRRNHSHLEHSYILQRSALVKMGVQLVNLFIGEILLPVTEREEFERKLEEAVRSTRGALPSERAPD